MQVAIYVRVSTTRQSQTQTIEQQMSRLQVEIKRHSDWDLLPEHVFRDDGISGATLNSPGIARLRDGSACHLR